jgi:hypothetical protein
MRNDSLESVEGIENVQFIGHRTLVGTFELTNILGQFEGVDQKCSILGTVPSN